MQREKQPKRPSPSTDEESGTDMSNSADKFEWVGEPLKTSVHRDFYKAVRMKDTGHVVKMRDNVMVEAGEENEPYVAKCLAMWEDKRTHVRWMRTQWYYRAGDVPEQAISTVKNYPQIIGKGGLRKREVFESQSHDDNDLRAMLTVATVVHDVAEFAKLQKNVSGTTTFLCRFSYDPREQMLRPLPEAVDAGDASSDEDEPKPASNSKTPNGKATSGESLLAPAATNSGSKSSKAAVSASKPKASPNTDAKPAKQPKGKAKPPVKPRDPVKKPRNNGATKSAAAAFVYTRDTGDTDVFAQEEEISEELETKLDPQINIKHDLLEGQFGIAETTATENEESVSASESESDADQGLLSPSGHGDSHARIGSEYQADVPSWEESQQMADSAALQEIADGKTDDGQQGATCVWQPSRFTYGVVETFLSSARQLMQLAVGQRVQVMDSSGRSTWCLVLSLAEGNNPLRKVRVFDGVTDWQVFACECRLPFPEDLALRCLMHANGDIGRALRTFNRVLKDRIFLTQNPQSPQWKRREVQAFCEAVQLHRDNLVAVSRVLRQRNVDKTFQDVLQLYYSMYLPRRPKRLASLWMENCAGDDSDLKGRNGDVATATESIGRKRGRDSDTTAGVFSSSFDDEYTAPLPQHELAAKKRQVAAMRSSLGVWSVKVDPDEPLNESATELLRTAKPLLSEQQHNRLKSYLRQQYNPRSDLPALMKKTIGLLTAFPTLLGSYSALISELKASRSA